MKTAQTRTQRLAWSLLASALALTLVLGISLALSHHQVSAQSAAQGTLNLGVSKEVNTTLAAPGDTLTYIIKVQNLDGVAVWLTDTLQDELTYVPGSLERWGPGTPVFSDGAIIWNVEELGFSYSAVITFSAQISPEVEFADIDNVIEVNSDGERMSISAPTVFVVAEIGELDNSLTEKTVTPEWAEPGDVLTYTIQVYNSDPEHSIPGTLLVDELPSGLDYVPASLQVLPDKGNANFANDILTWTHDMEPSDFIRLIFNARVSEDFPSDDAWVTNVATFSVPGRTITRTDTISVHRRVGQLQATKSVHPQEARPTEYLTYTVHLLNTGDGDLGGLWMTDELPSEVTFVTGTLTATWGSVGAVGDVITWTSTTEPDSTLLLPLEEVTVTYRVQIVEDVSKNARFTNTAQITGAGSLVMAQAPAQAITAFYMYLPIFIRNYPPVPIINAIPAPVNAAYTISWTEIQTEFDYYELEQSLDSDFGSFEESWKLTTNSRDIYSAICTYYYRVRVVNMDTWGEGPWTVASQAQPSPPTVTLDDISNADQDNTYTVSWAAPSVEVERYVLQESQDVNFGTLTKQWIVTSGTSQDVEQDSQTNGTFYYRVRADDTDCWGNGPWSTVKSTTVRPTYIYDFNSPTKIRNPWPIRRTTYWRGDREGVTWTEEHDGSMYILMSDKWDAAIASPMLAAPDLPYEIVAKVKIRDPSNLVSYGIIFGGNGGSPCPAYRDTGCLTHYYRLNVVWHSGLQANLKRIDYHEEEKGKGRGADLSDWVELTAWPFNVDPDGWNTWKISVHSNGFDVYLNGLLFKSIEDTTYITEPYFGAFTSTDEYKPSIGQFDYFYVRPK
jgi:uncharacterized repeat protein (TIGR01451 family)